MLTYDEIVKYIQENKTQNLTPYQGNNGIGVVYNVEIDDYGKSEPRLAIFDNITELARFADYTNYCDRITTDKRDLINSEPKFLLRGKILTPPIISAEKKKEKTLFAARKEYYNYSTRRGQVLIKRIETIQSEISELEEIIKNQTKKGALLFKNGHEDDDNKSLPNSENYNLDELPLDRETVSPRNFSKLKIDYEKLKWQREILNKKIEALREFAQKGFLKKLISSQKNINNALKQVDSEPPYTPSKNENDILHDEEHIYSVLHYLDNTSIVKSNPDYFLELLNFLKTIDFQALDTQINSIVEQEYDKLKAIAKSTGEHMQKEKIENGLPSKEEKISKLFCNLTNQFDANLTDEQKDATIIYNSQFFMLIGEISALENYETMNNQDILDILKVSPNYEQILRSINSHCVMLQRRAMYSEDGEPDVRLEKIMRTIFPGQTPQKLLSYISISDVYSTISVSSTYEKDFLEIMCNIIEKMKETIRTIQGIPQDAVVLPNDVDVFRGVDSNKLTNPQSPSKGDLMSTTLNPQIASIFGGNQPAIYKIHLKKGTPVQVLPDKVYRGQDAYQRFIRRVNPNDMYGSKEILIDISNMKDFEITESISTITNYKFENGEFEESKNGFIITGEMEPKIFQKIRNIDENEK